MTAPVISSAASHCVGRLWHGKCSWHTYERRQAMNSRDAVLAALATADGESYTPVQIQKLMFLIDERLGGRLGGKAFNFFPHFYGPFDPTVYHTAEALEASGLAEVEQSPGSVRTYGASPEGELEGQKVLDSLPPEAKDYIRE